MLRSCADYLSELPSSDVDALIDGELELRLSIAAKTKKPKPKSATKIDVGQLPHIATQLRSMSNRSDGERLIREVTPTKSAMEMLARHLDVAIRREDRLGDLMHRIVEATIGYRISSAAIQGKTSGHLRGESNDQYSPQSKK